MKQHQPRPFRLPNLRRLLLLLIATLELIMAIPAVQAFLGMEALYRVTHSDSGAPQMVITEGSSLGNLIERVPFWDTIVTNVAVHQWQVPNTSYRVPWLGVLILSLFLIAWRLWPRRQLLLGRHHRGRNGQPMGRETRSAGPSNADVHETYIIRLRDDVRKSFPDDSPWREAFIH
jgi:hypothetical protein